MIGKWKSAGASNLADLFVGRTVLGLLSGRLRRVCLPLASLHRLLFLRGHGLHQRGRRDDENAVQIDPSLHFHL